MNISTFIPLRLIAACALSTVFASTVFAITIDFESVSGYSAGNLRTGASTYQPSTGSTWSGGTTSTFASINVNTTGGSPEGRAVTQVGNAASNFQTYGFLPNTADLGMVFQAGVAQVKYSFDLALGGTPNVSSTAVARVRFGSSEPVRFELLSNGNFSIGNGASNVFTKTTSGGPTNFVAQANTYFTVTGTINFATTSFTASVNGVQQFSTGVDPNFAFASVGQAGDPRVNLINLNANSANWISTSFDNITLTAIPEPSTFAALAGLAAMVACVCRRKSHSATS